nr:unnamed protein product [Naegleria fowleri]
MKEIGGPRGRENRNNRRGFPYHHQQHFHHHHRTEQNFDYNIRSAIGNNYNYIENQSLLIMNRSSRNTAHYPNNGRRDPRNNDNINYHPYPQSASHISTNHRYSSYSNDKIEKPSSSGGNKQVTFKEAHSEQPNAQNSVQFSSTSHCAVCRELKVDLMCKGCSKCIHSRCCRDVIPIEKSSFYCQDCYTVQVQIKRDCSDVVCLENKSKKLIRLENATDFLVTCPLCNRNYKRSALDSHLSFQHVKHIEFDHEDIIPIPLPENNFNHLSTSPLEDEWNITFSKYLLVVGFDKSALEDTVHTVRFSNTKFQDNKKGVCLIGCGSSREAYQLGCFLRKQRVGDSNHPMIYFIKPYRALQLLELSRFGGSNEPSLSQTETTLKRLICDNVKFVVKQWTWRKDNGIITFDDEDHCILVMWYYYLNDPRSNKDCKLRFLKESVWRQTQPSTYCEIRNIPITFNLESLWHSLMEQVSLVITNNTETEIVEHALVQTMEWTGTCIKVRLRTKEFAQVFKLALDGMSFEGFLLQVVYLEYIGLSK